MKKRARLTESQRHAMLMAYRSGEKIAVIAERFGVDQSYPGLLAARRGLTLRVEQEARDQMSDAKQEKRFSTHADGTARRSGST